MRNVREDLVSAWYAYYLAEVTDALIEPADEARIPFELLQAALLGLEGGADPTLLAPHYLLQLLSVLGYRPELFRCLRCAAELQAVVNFLSVAEGGVLCPACGPGVPGARRIGVDELKLMRHLLRTPGVGTLALALPASLVAEVDRQVRAFVEHHLDRRLRSPEFIVRLQELGHRIASLPATAADAR